MELKLAYFYPDLMNLYGSRGNVLTLQQRCHWRGIHFSVVEVGLGEMPDLSGFDMVYLGGGRGREQLRIETDLRKIKAPMLRAAVEKGLVMLAICGGMQLLGEYHRPFRGPIMQGISLLDFHTEGSEYRANGDIIVQVELQPGCKTTLIGYENHSGRTYLGSGSQALAKVVKGFGNNGEDGLEGVRYRNCFGTYLHGPLLPKNPEFADYLILLALQRKYGPIGLSPLDDTIEYTTRHHLLRNSFTQYWLRGYR